ncbi:testis-expressed protein 40 [Heterocephalus glaber]|uniref:Testis-expressed protein 40 n=1 Tax=Heterocephalus glaber TaxID=10181 RepID=A0AAX6TDA8_HETGA|nr:testis-expressed protein 40 [Heterocephalus glaber]
MQLSEVHGNWGQEGYGTVYETYGRNSQRDLREDGDKSISLRDKDGSKPEDLDKHTLLELEPPCSSSLGIQLGEVASESEIRNEEHFSESLSSAWEHAGFPLYLAEQQKKLPLPLRELMETEALEILTKALKSEPPPPSFYKRSRCISQRVGLQEWSFRMCSTHCGGSLAGAHWPNSALLSSQATGPRSARTTF